MTAVITDGEGRKYILKDGRWRGGDALVRDVINKDRELNDDPIHPERIRMLAERAVRITKGEIQQVPKMNGGREVY